ncbi:hypothetical protein VP1G_10912 [Cytospora mali]|uniref:Uncharacterized protein n=1 Tax=Cytospora mali TaxID=578113 RepID=A0A194V0E5_CYTMA|nr:hypothetical protein VP1G_10912 [Valsa mali var. pyri (nom. inval.)]
MAPTSTRTGPLDDDSRAEHLAQLETTLYSLAGTGLFTQNDARQYFIQIARLVHIKLAAQCTCILNTNDPASTSSTHDEVQDPTERPEPVNNEPSESVSTSPLDEFGDQPGKRGSIRSLKRLCPKWLYLRKGEGDQKQQAVA